MLPFALVLLVASSAFAAPSTVGVTLYNINELAPAPDNGRLVSSSLITNSFDSITDGGDINVNTLNLMQVVYDLANRGDSRSQALAVGQVIAALGELSVGIPGDACEPAAVANAVASSNAAAIRKAVGDFVGRLETYIDSITQKSNNPNGVRYSTGPRSNCAGAGRSYQFEASWDAILNSAGPYSLPLVNEEYCVVKRLYNAFSSRSNNVGAAVTAASAPQVVTIVERALAPLANFLRVVASGGNPAQAAAVAKSALVQAASA